ncbi:hypothetical protein [Streptomyces sp. NRRL F-5053]|uniref:hypothetical protein n=1 Tax=Streptomyces sp. NRRL F-5053 TaxID=1463854 RepID=UPI0004C66A32|nr:hypothetical protein [Streptomyces sp. NRRL F-5053]
MTTTLTAAHQATARFPLVCRSHLVYPSFTARIEELHTCADKSAQAGPLNDRINAACATWNLAALIASDCGLPDLAADLCLRQLRLFQAAWPVVGDTAIAALQPMVNLIRLTARSGNPQAAYRQLTDLHHAVHHGSTVMLHGHRLDLTQFTTPATVRHIQPWLQFLMTDDGTRLLAATGQWARAAQHATAYDAEPTRLLDSRQARTLAAWHANDPDTADALLDEAQITEPWEAAVQQLLRHGTATIAGRTGTGRFPTVLNAAQNVVEAAAPHTRMFRVRLVRTLLTLVPTDPHGLTEPLCRTVVEDTEEAGDAFAAREILRSPSPMANERQRRNLEALVHDAGLGRGAIPAPALTVMNDALAAAGPSLARCLAQQSGQADGSETGTSF